MTTATLQVEWKPYAKLVELCEDEGLLKGFVERKRDVPEEARVPSPHGAPCAQRSTNPSFITRVAVVCAIDRHHPLSLHSLARRSSQPSLSALSTPLSQSVQNNACLARVELNTTSRLAYACRQYIVWGCRSTEASGGVRAGSRSTHDPHRRVSTFWLNPTPRHSLLPPLAFCEALHTALSTLDCCLFWSVCSTLDIFFVSVLGTIARERLCLLRSRAAVLSRSLAPTKPKIRSRG